jgi:hypothetical protein
LDPGSYLSFVNVNGHQRPALLTFFNDGLACGTLVHRCFRRRRARLSAERSGSESHSSEMIFTLISFIEMKRSFDSIPISSDLVNTKPPAANSAVLSLPMLAVPSGISQRVPQITPHDLAEIDAEVRGVLSGEVSVR